MSLSAQEILRAAVAAGLLPEQASLSDAEQRPWPVVLLTACGAWIAAIPLLGMVFALVGGLLDRGVGSYLIGLALLAGALQLLRRRGLPLFVEQLALPGLLVALGLLAFGLFRDLPPRGAALLLLALNLGLAVLLDGRPWLRVLLGAATALLLGVQLVPTRWLDGLDGAAGALFFWLAPHLLLSLWALALWGQQRWALAGARTRWAALIEQLGCGWLLVCLAALCWLAGMTLMLGGVLGGGELGGLAMESGRERALAQHWLPLTMRSGSLLAALAGVALLMRRWPSSRQPLMAALALVLAGLAWLLPTLGGALFSLALLASSQRWRQAGAAAAAAAWILGSFYYQLQWPLGEKALILVAAGALLGLLAWLLRARSATVAAARSGAAAARSGAAAARWALAGCGLLVLVVANGAIWQKESLIREGRPVYVALAPVDPRSLLQGDYMRLNFALPPQPDDEPLLQVPGAARPLLVARLDERGVAQPTRAYRADEPLAADELLLQLTPKNGRWVLVSDAWFFEEGRGEALAAARFGEFRVRPDGQALLVGLADQSLRPISR